MNKRKGFSEALSWMGAPPYPLLVYVVCSTIDESIVHSIKNYWPKNANVRYFKIYDFDWPFEIALFEISVQELDESIDNNISQTLSFLSERFRSPCIFMFEGGFSDYRNLFNPDSLLSVYGICIPGDSPFVGTVDETRASTEMALYLRRAREWLVSKYPQIDVG